MSTNHHTPHPFGNAVDSAQFNSRLADLDSAIGSAIAAGFVGAVTTLDAQALSGQKVLPVTATTDFIVGDSVWVGTPGSGLQETGIIFSISAGVSLTLVANLSSTHAIGTPVSRSPIEIVDARLDASTLSERLDWLRGAINVRRYGATGNGATDDLGAFQNAIAAVTAENNTIYVPAGSYLLSDNLDIDVDSIHFELDPGAEIFTDGPTTNGHTIAFIGGGAGLGTATSPQNEWASIRGGTVRNLNSGGLDNAIGFVRYANARCEGVRIPNADRKGITAQYGVDNIVFQNNVIEAAGVEGISVEWLCRRVQIIGNVVTSAGRGIGIPGGTGADTGLDVQVRGNRVTATGHGIGISNLARAEVSNNIVSSSTRGISAAIVAGLAIRGNAVQSAGEYPIFIDAISGPIQIAGNAIFLITGADNTFDGIYMEDCTARPQVNDNYLTLVNARYLINAANMASVAGMYWGNVSLAAGQTANFGGTAPLAGLNLVGGSVVKTGTW